MQKVTSLVPLLILGSVWIHHVALETLSLIQEDFDLDRFMGKWFELTVASTCPYYLQRKRANPVILALQMQHVASGSNFTLMSTTFRNGSCKTSSVDYALTDTPGRFFHHVSRFEADVDSYVVETDYDEYALLFQLSTEKPSGNVTRIVKLYSRTVDVSRPSVLDDFNALVRQHGMGDDAVVVNHIKGECPPASTSQSQVPESKMAS
ncbi:hypothetical protein JOB18_040978 [Solea senegalensis]|uniref:Lipocalin/cytosolic fatty-acid binding domain-containing protein n=1 Tax=Solea senegalensis TaxID=28829 RepID=A0AAV6R337_SOLSE|nr:protein AMBP-like [Solea senegalensis]KAG7499533.1 hypothetical protein JOB18_040978 [Solea senegalensis]